VDAVCELQLQRVLAGRQLDLRLGLAFAEVQVLRILSDDRTLWSALRVDQQVVMAAASFDLTRRFHENVLGGHLHEHFDLAVRGWPFDRSAVFQVDERHLGTCWNGRKLEALARRGRCCRCWGCGRCRRSGRSGLAGRGCWLTGLFAAREREHEG
jgi:hypothetical protein